MWYRVVKLLMCREAFKIRALIQASTIHVSQCELIIFKRVMQRILFITLGNVHQQLRRLVYTDHEGGNAFVIGQKRVEIFQPIPKDTVQVEIGPCQL